MTAGIETGHPDARRVERAIEDDLLRVEADPSTPLVERLARSDNLSDADVAVLALAAECEGVAVIDEQYGRTVAETEGIETRGTAYVVLSAQRNGVLDATEAREAVDDLLEVGWYCAPDLYAKIRDKIEELDEEDASSGRGRPSPRRGYLHSDRESAGSDRKQEDSDHRESGRDQDGSGR